MRITTRHRLLTIDGLNDYKKNGVGYSLKYVVADTSVPYRPRYKVLICRDDDMHDPYVLIATKVTKNGPDARTFVFGPALLKFHIAYHPEASKQKIVLDIPDEDMGR